MHAGLIFRAVIVELGFAALLVDSIKAIDLYDPQCLPGLGYLKSQRKIVGGVLDGKCHTNRDQCETQEAFQLLPHPPAHAAPPRRQ